jgi:hypothetical protein
MRQNPLPAEMIDPVKKPDADSGRTWAVVPL